MYFSVTGKCLYHNGVVTSARAVRLPKGKLFFISTTYVLTPKIHIQMKKNQRTLRSIIVNGNFWRIKINGTPRCIQNKAMENDS